MPSERANNPATHRRCIVGTFRPGTKRQYPPHSTRTNFPNVKLFTTISSQNLFENYGDRLNLFTPNAA